MTEEEQRFDDMASAVGLFIAQCGEMAEQNWMPSQVAMLKRLFGAVIKGCEYADFEEEVQMQIVIDISEEIKAVIDKNGTNEIVTETVWQAIKKGTPLPKGHGRLIDADALKKYIDDCGCCVGCENESYGCADKCECPDYLDEGMERIINNQPTIIEADKEVQE